MNRNILPQRRPRLSGRLASIALGLLIAGGIAAWVLSGDGEIGANAPRSVDGEILTGGTSTNAVAEAQPLLEVGVFQSEAQELVYELPLRGYTESSRRVEVRAETSGLVVSEKVSKGTTVSEGDVLCRIALGDRRALLTQAQARIAQAEADARSARSLAQSGYGPETAAAAAEAAQAAAQAEAERIRLDIARTEVTAPFGGILQTDSADTGTLLQPGALCATVIDLDPVHVVGYAPERSVGIFREGAPAVAQLSDGRRLDGTLSFVSRSAEPRTRTFQVELTASNADNMVLDGLGAEILVPVRRPNAHLVPQSALTLNDDGVLGLRIVENSRVRFVAVEALQEESGGIWVTGLPPQADVIVVGQEFAISGTEVAARPVPGSLQP